MLALKAFPPRLRLLSSSALRKAHVQTQRPPATAESHKHDQDCTSVEDRASPFTTQFLNHPYSLHEFDLAIPEYELQWRLHKAQLDSFNEDFWTDNNTRFEEVKSAVVSSLPDSAPAEWKERALSDFYARWLAQESARHAAYHAEWRQRYRTSILMQARVTYARIRSRLSNLLSVK